jgi:hypothetical protein
MESVMKPIALLSLVLVGLAMWYVLLVSIIAMIQRALAT